MRRLSIIDVDGGHQPLTNEDGTLWLIANGEIYNYRELRDDLVAKGHRFGTGSDCETILHLYEAEGDAFVERLNGMYAFALVGLATQTASDRTRPARRQAALSAGRTTSG